jgi:ribosomal-protein-alanine N-acetyltransferase
VPISLWRSGAAESPRRRLNFLIFGNQDNALMGGIGLSQVRHGAECGSLPYWMGERYADQGYTTEGLKLMLGFVFGRLNLHRAEATCPPHNAASRAAVTKNGIRE